MKASWKMIDDNKRTKYHDWLRQKVRIIWISSPVRKEFLANLETDDFMNTRCWQCGEEFHIDQLSAIHKTSTGHPVRTNAGLKEWMFLFFFAEPDDLMAICKDCRYIKFSAELQGVTLQTAAIGRRVRQFQKEGAVAQRVYLKAAGYKEEDMPVEKIRLKLFRDLLWERDYGNHLKDYREEIINAKANQRRNRE